MDHDDADFVARPEDAGQRLDAFLCARLSLSRAAARRLLDAAQVRYNGRPAREKGVILAAGDRVRVDDAGGEDAPLAEPDAPLAVAAQGEDWVVVNKPAGTAVHPLRPRERGTVLNALASRFPQIVGVGEGGLRSGVVHRLDVDTSGVLLFALTQPAWQRLREAFTSRGIVKQYLAIVHGELRGGRDESLHLTVARHRPALVKVVDAARAGESGVRRCTLAWHGLAASRTASLIEVDLGTGFLHQVRVMLAHRGHPLVGDTAYGGEPIAGAARPMLHARRLKWEAIDAHASPPEDFAAACAALGLDQPPF